MDHGPTFHRYMEKLAELGYPEDYENDEGHILRFETNKLSLTNKLLDDERAKLTPEDHYKEIEMNQILNQYSDFYLCRKKHWEDIWINHFKLNVVHH